MQFTQKHQLKSTFLTQDVRNKFGNYLFERVILVTANQSNSVNTMRVAFPFCVFVGMNCKILMIKLQKVESTIFGFLYSNLHFISIKSAWVSKIVAIQFTHFLCGSCIVAIIQSIKQSIIKLIIQQRS